MADPGPRPAALEEIIKLVVQAETKVIELKKAANAVAVALGRRVEYAEEGLEAPRGSGTAHIRPDQFANYSAPSMAARAFLEQRGKSLGAVGSDEIFAALKAGGYPFDGTDDQAKGGLKVALGKDGKIQRLASGAYGLLDWYPLMKREKGSKDAATPKVESVTPAEAPQTVNGEA